MDILRLLSARRLALLLAALALLELAFEFHRYPERWYRNWRYHPVAAEAPDAQILQDNERRESDLVLERYHRLLEALDQAQAQGRDTSGLRLKAQAAMTLNVKAYRRQAIRLLNQVEMAIPAAPPRKNAPR
ncbi:MAG: hypothetical protein KGO96_02605 [Elusimicrobia bacterium]|nr:hypothetical protein [Elusimicrobiota bacterium]MDE2237490.1 hypothetical protein [Elusimicrobiota bacterium]MDE2424785.1 hypothetical protein [Elusimicrobiota bacterium]